VIARALHGRAKSLAPDQRDAIRMAFVKISRIVNGDADYIDNWDDFAGYPTLVAQRLRREAAERSAQQDHALALARGHAGDGERSAQQEQTR